MIELHDEHVKKYASLLELEYRAYRASWWMATMDAEFWWHAESVEPGDAAMLLSGFNPNTEKAEDCEKAEGEEITSQDFQKLRRAFAGAKEKDPRTLCQWIDFAGRHLLKTHSWIADWQIWEKTSKTSPQNETAKQRRQRQLVMYEEEEKQEPRGALQRIANREGVDHSNLSKALAKAREERVPEMRNGTWVSQLVKDGRRHP